MAKSGLGCIVERFGLMLEPDRLALILSTVCFLGAFAAAAYNVLAAPYRSTLIQHILMALGFVGQCAVLGIRGKELGRCPITSPWEVLVFISWGAVMFYWVIGRTYRLSLLGIFTAPLVWFFQVLALALQGTVEPGAGSLAFRGGKIDPWLEWHATMSLLSYASFSLAAVAGLMFLVQDRQLKSHRPSRLIFNLPPLSNLNRGLLGLLHVGFGLLTVGIAAAYFMERQPPAFKLTVSWGIWAAYLGILLFQWFRGWPHRRLAGVTAAVFLLPLASLWIVTSR